MKNEEYHILAKKLHRLDDSLAQVVESGIDAGIDAHGDSALKDMPKTLVSAHAALKRAQSLLDAHQILQSYQWHAKLPSQTAAVTLSPPISIRIPSTPPAVLVARDALTNPQLHTNKVTVEITPVPCVGIQNLTYLIFSTCTVLLH